MPASTFLIKSMNVRQLNYSLSCKNSPAIFSGGNIHTITVDLDKEISSSSIVRMIIDEVDNSNIIRFINCENRDRHGFKGIDMLKAVILAHSLGGSVSVREMADMSKHDIRFRLIFPTKTPSFMSFQRFIKNDLSGSVEDTFYEFNKYLAKKYGDLIDTDMETIDGTKEESFANKFTFVWRKASEKFYAKCYTKIDKLLVRLIKYCKDNKITNKISILKKIDIPYLYDVQEFLITCINERKIKCVYGKGKRKHELQSFLDELNNLSTDLFKYEIHFDLLGDRNSFSKTDVCATFMHMKYDYYCHTNVFKPGYNVQFGVCSGFIWDIYISPDCNDQKTFIPLMKQHFSHYNSYPKRTPADAGYGSYDNYSFCVENNIELFMKYSGYEAKKKKLTDKNRFQTNMLPLNEDGLPICPAGHVFYVSDTYTSYKGEYPKQMQVLKNDHCPGCPMQKKCTKAKDGIRKIKRNQKLVEWEKEVDDNIATEKGQEYMNIRRIFSEGIFGDKKYNWRYDKLRRIGETGVKTEIYLYAFGKNMRRLHTLLNTPLSKEEEKLLGLMSFLDDIGVIKRA